MSDLDNILNEYERTDDGIQRDKYDRPVLPDPTTGEIRPWTRVTTLANILDNTSALETWRTRNIVYGIGRREDLYVMAASVGSKDAPEDKATLDAVITGAEEAAEGSAKANLGTGSHGFTQRHDMGDLVDNVPAQYVPDIEAYKEAQKTWGLWPFERYIETFVVVPELGAAGTFDRLLMGDGWELPRIGDLKTGKVKGKGRSFAVQLAIYAHASHWYDPKTKMFYEMPEVDRTRGVIIHLPIGEGRCEPFEVDLVAGWEGAQLAADIHRWRKRDDLCLPLSRWLPAPVADPSGEGGNASPAAVAETTDKPPKKERRRRRTKAEMQAARAADAARLAELEAIAAGRAAPTPADETSTDSESDLGEPVSVQQADTVAEAPAPDNTLTVPTVDPAELFEARYQWAKARVQYVAVTHGQAQQLAHTWSQTCADIPTFRNGGPRNDDEIDRVAGACHLVEMAEQLPFFEPDPAREKTQTDKWITGDKQNDEHRQLTIA